MIAKTVMCAGRDAAYTPIDALGNSINGGELEVNVEDMGEQMIVEICDQAHQVIAMSTIGLASMWEVRNNRHHTCIDLVGEGTNPLNHALVQASA